MEKKTEGAWIVHHARKLQSVVSQDFDQTAFAGKCGLLLSAIAASTQTTLSKPKLDALATATRISPRAELPAILDELARQKLIDQSSTEVSVLGLSTQSVLGHTSTIFREGNPKPEELAAIEIAESVSEMPLPSSELREKIGDTFKLASADATDLLKTGESIGFFDAETNSAGDQLIFNGNLFRSGDIKKITIVLSALSDEESRKFRELNDLLAQTGCISLRECQKITGEQLFTKLHSIGLYDVSKIGNEQGSHYFVTKPASFSKFTSSVIDDAFDLAKAFVTALTYGMTSSQSGRGRIQMITVLMNRLISGNWIGPATAIGQDYKILEMKGVVEVRHSRGSMYEMRLLKPEVGKLALAVIQEGEIAGETLTQLPSSNVSHYVVPEENRGVVRKNISEPLKRTVGNLLNELRTGGIKK
ncbi:hypothetical protein [Herbaspirillum huttiense]|uniref:hypothetical protein n=1 Tax=Herbaspirillum huttiense TaxID=863372 RepID=UPI002176C829|nr:hypothetical protein [Herbaspirillum huttiense]UWE19016.1 hypothetical protein NY669_12800 [Herbaspirillum huttiense]